VLPLAFSRLSVKGGWRAQCRGDDWKVLLFRPRSRPSRSGKLPAFLFVMMNSTSGKFQTIAVSQLSAPTFLPPPSTLRHRALPPTAIWSIKCYRHNAFKGLRKWQPGENLLVSISFDFIPLLLLLLLTDMCVSFL